MLWLLAAISIAVNDRPLNVVAVEVRGSVLVPMRPLFESLGAAVRFDDRRKRVSAKLHDRSVSVTPGEAGSRIISGRTYVPLRFVASTLGAVVGYDPDTQLVSVRTEQPATRDVRAAGVPAPSQPVRGLAPPPDSNEATAFPTITATIAAPQGVSIATLLMTIDGINVTRDASYGGASITYIPRGGLPIGSHAVRISGTMTSGADFERAWSFSTSRAASPSVGAQSAYYGTGLQLTVAGNVFGPNQYMPVQLVAPPGGQAYAFVCNSPWQYPMYAPPASSFYSVTLQAPWGTNISQCPITAMYVSPTGEVLYAPYPIYVMFQPLPLPGRGSTPAPTPTPVRYLPGPVHTRAPQTPLPPAPARIPVPVRTTPPHPLPVVTLRPVVRPPIHVPARQPVLQPRPVVTKEPS